MKPDDDKSLPPHHTEITTWKELLESLPESKRWDPVPGSEGHQTPESVNEDEDAEGRSESEQLVDDGVEQAEREQAKEADRAAVKKAASES